MKKIIAALLSGLVISTLLVTYTSARTAESVKDNVLRLHILANSDSHYDQQLKLKVRDAIIKESECLFKTGLSKEESVYVASLNLGRFEEIARNVLKKNGCSSEVKISISQCFFPTKEYESGYRLPAGYYDALKIEIGEAKGKNWWCILYPPLCFGGSVKESGAEDMLGSGELEFVTTECIPEIKVKFKLVEIWNNFINKLSKNT